MDESRRPISATELAELGACERRALLKLEHPEKVSWGRRMARRRGDREHLRHHHRVVRYSRPCFIATAVYGDADAPSVATLRGFRDQVLLRSRVGTALVWLYYCWSPALARRLVKHPRLCRVLQFFLDALVRWL